MTYIDEVEDLAAESASILFDFPEVAMEKADPTKFHFPQKFKDSPFSQSSLNEMKQYYSAMIQKLIPIALDVAKDTNGIFHVERIDTTKVIEKLKSSDYNALATKTPDSKTHVSPGIGYGLNSGSLALTAQFSVKLFREYVYIRKLKGRAVLSVDIANIQFTDNSIFNKVTKINKDLTERFNAKTNNAFKDDIYLTTHFVGADKGSLKEETALQLNFIIPKKWCV